MTAQNWTDIAQSFAILMVCISNIIHATKGGHR